MTDHALVIEELLKENSRLRLQFAFLVAQQRAEKEMEERFAKSSQGLTPEVAEQISPAALEALSKMEIR